MQKINNTATTILKIVLLILLVGVAFISVWYSNRSTRPSPEEDTQQSITIYKEKASESENIENDIDSDDNDDESKGEEAQLIVNPHRHLNNTTSENFDTIQDYYQYEDSINKGMAFIEKYYHLNANTPTTKQDYYKVHCTDDIARSISDLNTSLLVQHPLYSRESDTIMSTIVQTDPLLIDYRVNGKETMDSNQTEEKTHYYRVQFSKDGMIVNFMEVSGD